jgi:hypothetical protein
MNENNNNAIQPLALADLKYLDNDAPLAEMPEPAPVSPPAAPEPPPARQVSPPPVPEPNSTDGSLMGSLVKGAIMLMVAVLIIAAGMLFLQPESEVALIVQQNVDKASAQFEETRTAVEEHLNDREAESVTTTE